MIKSRSRSMIQSNSNHSVYDARKVWEMNRSHANPSFFSLRRYGCFAILIGICLIFYIMFGFGLGNGHMSDAQRERVMSIAQYGDKISLLMNTFKRHDMMESAISYYSACPIIQDINIVWSESKEVPERLRKKYDSETRKPKVNFLVQDFDSLNNRFRPIPPELKTSSAVYSVDDDVRVRCEDLAVALEVWRGSRESIVGFMPRLHIRRSEGNLDYRCWWKVWLRGQYSIVLTKAALFNAKYLAEYTYHMPETVRQLVDTERNCEDLAMQFLISNSSHLPPIMVKSRLEDLGSLNGISMTGVTMVKSGHMSSRGHCLDALVKAFGHNPLIMSHHFVDAANNRWTNSPSTWHEYISSDLWKWFD